MPKRVPAKVDARDLANEIIRRARAGVVTPLATAFRMSSASAIPRNSTERLQLAACRILRHPIAIMPAACATMEEWLERYSKLARR